MMMQTATWWKGISFHQDKTQPKQQQQQQKKQVTNSTYIHIHREYTLLLQYSGVQVDVKYSYRATVVFLEFFFTRSVHECSVQLISFQLWHHNRTTEGKKGRVRVTGDRPPPGRFAMPSLVVGLRRASPSSRGPSYYHIHCFGVRGATNYNKEKQHYYYQLLLCSYIIRSSGVLLYLRSNDIPGVESCLVSAWTPSLKLYPNPRPMRFFLFGNVFFLFFNPSILCCVKRVLCIIIITQSRARCMCTASNYY